MNFHMNLGDGTSLTWGRHAGIIQAPGIGMPELPQTKSAESLELEMQ